MELFSIKIRCTFQLVSTSTAQTARNRAQRTQSLPAPPTGEQQRIQQSDHLDIPLLRHKQMRRIGQSDNASKQHPHPHPHPHPHTRTPALPTFAQSFRAFHLPMPALFPSTTIRSYRCPQPIFENKRIRPAGRKYPENRTAT